MMRYLRAKLVLLLGPFAALTAIAFCLHLLVGWSSAMWFWGAAAAYPAGFMVSSLIHMKEWAAVQQEQQEQLAEHQKALRKLV